ncbi:MAG: FliM/FliN family flagellar motor switch protein [Pseudomonadota bacterium]
MSKAQEQDAAEKLDVTEHENEVMPSLDSDADAQGSEHLPEGYDDAIAQLRGVASGEGMPQSADQPRNVNKSVYNIPVRLEIIVGAVKLPVSKLMALEPGEILNINKQVGQELEIQANGSTIGRGELVVTDDHDGTLGFKITHIDHME